MADSLNLAFTLAEKCSAITGSMEYVILKK